MVARGASVRDFALRHAEDFRDLRRRLFGQRLVALALDRTAERVRRVRRGFACGFVRIVAFLLAPGKEFPVCERGRIAQNYI